MSGWLDGWMDGRASASLESLEHVYMPKRKTLHKGGGERKACK